MSNHFSLLSGVAEYDEGFSADEILKWSDLAKKALAKNSCTVNKRTVAKRFSLVDYNNAINQDIALFVSQNPFLVVSTISFQIEKIEQDTDVFTSPHWTTELKITYPLNLWPIKQLDTQDYILIGRRDDNSLEAVNDVIVICEIIEFPKTSLNLFKDLL